MKSGYLGVVIAALWGGILLSAFQESDATPAITLRVVGCEDAAGPTIWYFLYGPFGGYGSSVQTEPGRSEYVIPAAHEGRPAEKVRALVYCPDHAIVLLPESSFVKPPGGPIEVRLTPLGSIQLAGKVMYPAADKLAGVRIEVIYVAYWSHQFFGIADGPVVALKVASTDVSEDGSFEASVPDFARDPVVAAYSERRVLQLIARESETGNRAYQLELTHIPGRSAELPIAAKYPRLELYGFPGQ